MNASECSNERGSGNVFADLDLPDADTPSACIAPRAALSP